MPFALHYAARTDLGLGSKSRNEDSAYAGPDLLVVADGMGGHAAGDVASSTVVGELVALDGAGLGADDALDQLADAFRRANAILREEMEAAEDLSGMGTTCIAMLRSGTKLALANIGDSRAFLMREGQLTQITKDHSFVQALVDDGRITREEADHHPQRNMVTRVLTGRPEDEPDLSLREMRVGDRYLICSDGLSDYVARSTIEDILRTGASPAETADQLIAIALRAATRDNVTVVVADVVSSNEGVANAPQVAGAAADRNTAPDAQRPQTPAEKAAALRREVNEPPPQQDGAAGVPPGGSTAMGPQLAEEGPRRRSRGARWGVLALALVALLGLAGFLTHRWTQTQYYVGQKNGMVTVYQGLPQDLGPLKLHSVDTQTDIAVQDLPSFYRSKVSDTLSADDRDGAIRIAEDLRAEMVKCTSTSTKGGVCTQ